MTLKQHRSHAFLYGQDPGVRCPGYAAWPCGIWAIQTKPRQRSHEALTLAQELSHPFSLAYALSLLPGSISSVGRGKQPKSGQRQ